MSLLKKPKSVTHGAAKVRSHKQEKDRAAKLGGRLTPCSGSKSVKGDVRVKGVLRLECKNTVADSFSVTLDMLRKIENAATHAGELPCIEVEFIYPDGTLRGRAVVLPSYALDMFLDRM